MIKRIKIPHKLYDAILLKNRHACCVCGKGDVQEHHINGDKNGKIRPYIWSY